MRALLLGCFWLTSLGLSAQISTGDTGLPDTYIALTAEEFESLMNRLIALRRQQLYIQQQQQRTLAAASQATYNAQSPDRPQAAAPGSSATDQRIAQLEQQLRDLARGTSTAPTNSPVYDSRTATGPNTGTTDPRVDALLTEIDRLQYALSVERSRLDRVEDQERERIVYELDDRTVRAQSEYELDRLRREGKLNEQDYRYERRLLRERQRLAELENERDLRRTTIVDVPVAPAPNANRPNLVPVPYPTPGGRDTVVIVNPGVPNNDAALQAEINALKRTIADLQRTRNVAPPAPVVTPAPPVVTRPAAAAVTRDFPAILFDNASAAIAPTYQSVVQAVADAYRKGRISEVQITGYASPTGSAQLNQQLSRRRAEAVRAALEAAGVPGELIESIYGGINYQYTNLAAARRVDIRAIGQ